MCALVFATCYYQNTDLMSKVGTFLGSGAILSGHRPVCGLIGGSMTEVGSGYRFRGWFRARAGDG